MPMPSIRSLRSEFTRRTEAAIYRRFQRRQQEERQRREEREEARTDSAELLDMAALIVTEMEINAFRVEIDRYDVATIEALQQNEIALAKAREDLDRLFAKAHVLADGRRVFKTQDGTRVFDEFGHELAPDVVAPDEIADERPRWETAREIITKHKELAEERQELLDYQAKLDEARERLDAGDLTRDEFDRLREELTADMPDTVRAHVAGAENEPLELEASDPVAGQDTDLVIEDDMVPSQLPDGPVPG